jgi:NAD(P)-dependent dehydrogenase (short-subunit alcohol dehydrogenase family)
MKHDEVRPMTTDTEGLAGHVAIVTGGASGIGAAVAARLRDDDAKVAVFDLRPAPCADLSLEVDVGDPAAVLAAVERVAHVLGRPTLAVHCAGITRDAVLWKLSEADWDAALRVNLTGAWALLRAIAPHVRAAGDGSVVLVGSINGARGKIGQAAYAASKAGLVGLAKTAAREFGRFGARVNVVAPGFVDTAMTAALAHEWREKAIGETVLGRVAHADDVAHPIVFLLSHGARHVTGQVLNVDGGQDM